MKNYIKNTMLPTATYIMNSFYNNNTHLVSVISLSHSMSNCHLSKGSWVSMLMITMTSFLTVLSNNQSVQQKGLNILPLCTKQHGCAMDTT